MKYIKQFENYLSSINVGDYVHINTNEHFLPYCKIIKKNEKNTESWNYIGEYVNITKNKIQHHPIYNILNPIIRKMTPEEIIDFENRKDAIKYNI